MKEEGVSAAAQVRSTRKAGAGASCGKREARSEGPHATSVGQLHRMDRSANETPA